MPQPRLGRLHQLRADVPDHGLEHRSPHARYAILTRRAGRWSAELIALAYDWDAASRQAGGLGWPQWAQALATGRVE